MAANSKSRGITSLGKRVINQIWTANSPSPTHSFSPSAPALTARGAAYSSLYEKNPDDQIHSSAVPDDVIQAAQSDKYWAPHPQTGVFGPHTEHVTPVAGGERGFISGSASTATNAGGSGSSVLEEKAWFRLTSIEDQEKPHSLP